MASGFRNAEMARRESAAAVVGGAGGGCCSPINRSSKRGEGKEGGGRRMIWGRLGDGEAWLASGWPVGLGWAGLGLVGRNGIIFCNFVTMDFGRVD